jgi:hypothetical protein
LAAFFNTLFTGCSKVVNLPLEETYNVSHEQIVGITLKNGSEVIFDQHGGRYSPAGNAVTGVTPEGRRIEKTLRDLSYVKVIDLDADQGLPMAVDVEYFHDWRENAAPKNIAGVVTNQGQTHKFKFGNGRIDADQKVVVGFSQEDTWIAIPFDDVAYVQTKVRDGRKTALLVGVYVVASFALLVYSMHDLDMSNIDDDPYRDAWSH